MKVDPSGLLAIFESGCAARFKTYAGLIQGLFVSLTQRFTEVDIQNQPL